MQNQPTPFPLAAVNFAANGRSTIDLTPIPASIGGRPTQVMGITFDVQATPTLSAGTATAEQLQKLVRNLVIRDAVRTHFDGSFASMRLYEALEQGQLFVAEPDAAATLEAVNFARSWLAAPPLMAKPADFFVPGAAFGTGSQIEISFGALTDINANVTALTAVVQPTVWLTVADGDIKLMPILERRELTVTKDVAIGAEALYLFAALCKSNAFASIATGDFANIQITAANGIQTKQLHAAAYTRAYHEFMKSSPITQVQGEARAATDDNTKVPNGTALAAATAIVQPVIFTPPSGKISKTLYAGQNELVIGWSGTAANAYGLFTRILKRTRDHEEQYLAVIQQKLGKTLRSPKVDTESKRPYAGDQAPYLPIKWKF